MNTGVCLAYSSPISERASHGARVDKTGPSEAPHSRSRKQQIIQALFLCAPFLFKKGKCSPFLELTPTLWQMPRDITNISEDWADFCQCQEFWCHFLSFDFLENGPFGFERAPSASQKALSKSKGTFLHENEFAKWHQNCELSKSAEGNGEYLCLWNLLRRGQKVNFQMAKLA